MTDETGAYSFAVNSGSYSVNPSGPCSSFSPSVGNLNNIKANTVQNFTGASCPPAPLTLCPEFDADFGLTEPASGNVSSSEACAGDRLSTWANTIQDDWFTINTDDWRFGTWNDPPIVNRRQHHRSAGLPFHSDRPAVAQVHDGGPRGALDEYVHAIEQSLSDNGSPALTPAQITAIQSQLASAASRVKGITQSSQLSFSTCLPDGGAP